MSESSARLSSFLLLMLKKKKLIVDCQTKGDEGTGQGSGGGEE